MATKRIEERHTLAAGKVDRSGIYPIVRDVPLCGPVSANRRRYLVSAFAGDRVKRYENVKGYINHGRAREPRGYEEHLFNVINPRHRADGMPVGDLKVRPKHPMAEQFLLDAEHDPESCGMSHVAECETVTSPDGWEEITEILEVISVDLVTDPATVKGLREHKARPMTLREFAKWVAKHPDSTEEQSVRAKRLAEMDDMADVPLDAPAPDVSPEDGIKDAFKQAIAHLVDQCMSGDGDPKECLKKIKKLIDSHGEVNGKSEPADEPADDDEGEDMPKESRPQPWDVLRECQEAGYAASAAELELLSLQPDAAKRKTFVSEQKAKLANAKAEKPVSAARRPGADVKTEDKTEPRVTWAD